MAGLFFVCRYQETGKADAEGAQAGPRNLAFPPWPSNADAFDSKIRRLAG
jgi:hypothetical protein